MEQVLPGLDPMGDRDADPILEAVDCYGSGEIARGNRILNSLLVADLRCLFGWGLCQWRLGHFGDAEKIFSRLLWLNPMDNQGVRFGLDDVRNREEWTDAE